MRQNLMQHNTHDSGIEPDSLSLQDIIEIADTYHMDLTHPDPEQLRAAVERDLDGCEFWLLPSLMSGGIYGSIEMIGPFIIARYRDDGPRPQQVQAQYHELLHVVKGQISPGQKLIFKDRRRLWTPMERQCESGARILTRYTLLERVHKPPTCPPHVLIDPRIRWCHPHTILRPPAVTRRSAPAPAPFLRVSNRTRVAGASSGGPRNHRCGPRWVENETWELGGLWTRS